MPSIDVCRLRLANQHLVGQTLDKAADVVQLLGAVQAQDYSSAKWALAQRTRTASDSQIEKEIDDGEILRTHVLRPTWHFVGPTDIRWMLALTGPRVKALLGHYDRKLELDAAVIRRTQSVFTKALRGGKYLTRAELAHTLTKAKIRADGTQRLAHIVMHAELDGVICSAPRRGKQFTYALLDERVPPAKKMERDAALGALATRYFVTRGPATEDDFAWWSGLTKADAKSAVYATDSTLDNRIIDGRRYWFQPPAITAKLKSPLVRLLPNYDEFFIGLKDRSALHAKLGKLGIAKNYNALSGHIMTIDGQIVGGWTRTLSGKSVAVTLRPLTRLTDAEDRAVEAEANRYATFLGSPLRLEHA